jgi:hypothetical protein
MRRVRERAAINVRRRNLEPLELSVSEVAHLIDVLRYFDH